MRIARWVRLGRNAGGKAIMLRQPCKLATLVRAPKFSAGRRFQSFFFNAEKCAYPSFCQVDDFPIRHGDFRGFFMLEMTTVDC